MNVVEAWGSGIPKMFREAEEYGLAEPELIDMGSDFRVNLYRKAAVVDQNGVVDPKGHDTKNETNDTKIETNDATQSTTQTTQSTTQTTQSTTQTTQENILKFTEEDKHILALVHDNPAFTQKELAMELGWTVDRVKYYLNKMKKQQIIKRVGSSHKGYWMFLFYVSLWQTHP